jgi:FG-GAP repeat
MSRMKAARSFSEQDQTSDLCRASSKIRLEREWRTLQPALASREHAWEGTMPSHVVAVRAAGLIVATLFLFPQLALAQFTQQGPKLVGARAVGNACQGVSVALSADGNTAIMDGYGDDANVGAAWVFTRSNGSWTQQGDKLIGSDAVNAASQGYSVAISADGNTVLIGGPGDNPGAINDATGAAWVFTQSGGVWTQQGSKLVGTGWVTDPGQVTPSRYPAMGTPPLWVALATIW